mgnify:CR=1 FL=1
MISYSAIYSIIAFRLKEFFSEYQYSLLAPITTNTLFILVFLGGKIELTAKHQLLYHNSHSAIISNITPKSFST